VNEEMSRTNNGVGLYLGTSILNLELAIGLVRKTKGE
jgi:hypothetical protein